MSNFEEFEGEVLNEPLNISDLIASGKCFEISSKKVNPEMKAYDGFDDFGFSSDEEEEVECKLNQFISPYQEPFDNLRPTMTKINDFVYKQVIYKGIEDSEIVPNKARVIINYTSYAENVQQTYDTTYLRGRPLKFVTGNQEVLPGIEMAVMTMKKDEESNFIISHKVLFGELGCPPRIPPKRDFLYIIKLLRFEEVGDLEALKTVAEEDKKRFKIVFPKIKEIHKKGVDFFKLKNYPGALKAFHSGVHNLMFCNLSDEHEQREYTEFMIKLYTNLAIIYSILEQPARVCSMCNDMRQVSLRLYKKNIKALYREGKAYSDLGEYDLARKKLMEAKALQPTNEDIIAELEKLNTRKREYIKQNQELCARVFGSLNIKDKSNDEVNDSFYREMKETLLHFKSNDEMKEIQLPEGLLPSEMSCVESLTKELNMTLTTVMNNKKVIVKTEN